MKEPRLIPTVKDLEHWIDATREMLSTPARTVDGRDGNTYIYASEFSLLDSIVRMRKFCNGTAQVPEKVLEQEAELLSKRLSDVCNAPIEVRVKTTQAEKNPIGSAIASMRTIEPLPCPWCKRTPIGYENKVRAWFTHPVRCDCILAGFMLKTEDEARCWNERIDRINPEDVPEPTLEEAVRAVFEEEIPDTKELFEISRTLKPCRFCGVKPRLDVKYETASIVHPVNGCVLSDMHIGTETAEGWNA